MKYHLVIPTIVLLALTGPAAQAQQPASPDAQRPHSMEEVEQRFQQMKKMMADAERTRGPKRRKLMLQHMQMMREQMADAHGMMNRMRGGGRMVPGTGSTMDRMQERLDMMQRLMVQMLNQQELMLKSMEH